MRPARTRRSLALPAVVTAAFGLLAVPVATPTVASAQAPGMAVVACDLGGDLEAVLGDRFGGIWLDVPTQHLRVGLLDPADEPAARAVVEACDAKGAAGGRLTLSPAAPDTAYVVVETSYPALRRAQEALTAWRSSPAGLPLSPRIVSYGIGLGDGDPNADGYIGMVLRVRLHLDTTPAELALIEQAVDEIAAEHDVTVEIDEQRTDYPTPSIGLPGPGPQPEPPTPPSVPTPPSQPSILSRKAVSRRATLRTRRLPVRLWVAEGGALRVTVRTADRRRTVIARGTATPKGSGQLTVRTNLTAAGQAQLRKARRSRVVITVKQTGQKAVTRRIAVG